MKPPKNAPPENDDEADFVDLQQVRQSLTSGVLTFLNRGNTETFMFVRRPLFLTRYPYCLIVSSGSPSSSAPTTKKSTPPKPSNPTQSATYVSGKRGPLKYTRSSERKTGGKRMRRLNVLRDGREHTKRENGGSWNVFVLFHNRLWCFTFCFFFCEWCVCIIT